MDPVAPLKTPTAAADWCRSVAHTRIIPDHMSKRLREIAALLREGKDAQTQTNN